MDTWLIHNNSKLWRYAHIWHLVGDQGTCIKSTKQHLDQGTHTTCSWLISHQTPFGHINTVAVNSQYKPQINKLVHHYMIDLMSGRFFIINATEYWLFAHKFSTWNASITALQFWTEELDPQTLSTTIERVYTAFYSDSAQHLQQEEEEVLFSHFVTTLNDAFEWALASEDIGYESGSKSMNVLTALHQEPWPFHVSMQENLSYGPAIPRTWPSPRYPHAVHCQLTYEDDDTSSLMLENHSSEDDILAHHLPSIAVEEDYDMEEHFPTVSLYDNFWKEEPVPERHLCIHENVQHNLCPYPWPYDYISYTMLKRMPHST